MATPKLSVLHEFRLIVRSDHAVAETLQAWSGRTRHFVKRVLRQGRIVGRRLGTSLVCPGLDHLAIGEDLLPFQNGDLATKAAGK
jgi:hypothetical protein